MENSWKKEYNTYTLKNPRKCSQCSSELILISTNVEKREGNLFPETISVYRCSVQECQDEKDKQTAKRQALLKEKELLVKQRQGWRKKKE